MIATVGVEGETAIAAGSGGWWDDDTGPVSFGLVGQATSYWTGQPGEWAGYAVGVGDLDGDGALDLAIGAPGVPAIYTQPVSTDESVPIGQGGAAVRSSGPEWTVGESLIVDDLDGGGVDDLLFSVWSDAGGAYMVAGPVVGEMSADDAVSVLPCVAPYLALASADLDGDGYREVVVGDSLVDSGAGEVHVANLSGAEMGTFQMDWGRQIGSALATGDMDGDGDADLVVGAPGDPGAMHGQEGAVYILAGPLEGGAMAADLVLKGEHDGGAGCALAVGDADGDGADDLLVGAPSPQMDDGESTVYYGTVYLMLDLGADLP